MEDALIIGGIVLAFLLLRKGSVTVSTPSDVLPTSASLSGGALVSGGYQVIPPSTQLASGAVTPGSLPSYVAPPPVGAPPPPYYGGTGGTVGTGGAGLGGPVVAGVSVGTATTVTRVVNGYTRQITILGNAPGTPASTPTPYRAPTAGTPYRAPTSTSMVVPTVIA